MSFDATKPNTTQADLAAAFSSVRENEADLNARVQSMETAGVVAKANELAAGRGNKTTLSGRLDVSIDADGNLKFDSLRQALFVASGDTPTYASASSFTIPTDRTLAYQAGVLLKFTLTTGAVYAAVQSSSYAASTTTVVLRKAVLDATLSAVSFGLAVLDREHVEIPAESAVLFSASNITGLAVYDVLDDSDAGAWRDRMEHTSWYTEALDTAARGSRRGFPARALVAIVAGTTDELRIYDGDDPDLALWKSWDITDPTAVACRDGKIMVGTATDLFIIDLAADLVTRYGTTGRSVADQTPATFDHDTVTWTVMDATPALIGAAVADIDVIVPDWAPIDPASGLPMPIIAAAVTGAATVLLPDGRSADSTLGGTMQASRFLAGGYLLYGRSSGNREIRVSSPARFMAGDGYSGGTLKNNSTVPVLDVDLTAVCGIAHGFARGSASGLELFALDHDGELTEALRAIITDDYATGWMPGDCRLALFEIDDTDIVAAVPVDEDCSETTGWTIGANWAHDSGNDEFDHTDGDTAVLSFAVTGLVTGKSYVMAATIGNRTAGSVTASIDGITGSAVSADGETLINFTATGTTATLTFTPASAFDGSIQAASVTLAVKDRSPKSNHVQAVGTITATDVETSAETVAFSGFTNATNYLRRPYDADFDIGASTGLTVSMWFKTATAAAAYMLSRANTGETGNLWRMYLNGSAQFRFDCGPAAGLLENAGTIALNDDTWHHAVTVIDRVSDRLWTMIDGVIIDSTDISSIGDLTQAGAELWIGQRTTGADSWAGSLALPKVSASAITPAQARRIWNDERRLFRIGAQATLGGTSEAVAALTFDQITDTLHVGTGDGVSALQGLARTDYVDQATNLNLTTDSIVAVAAHRDAVLIATSAQAVVALPAVQVKDRLAAPLQALAMERLGVWQETTSDATPTDVVKLPIAEGENVTVRARIRGQEHRHANGESAAYEIVGRFYREHGGNVTQRGSTASLVAIESTGSMAGDFSVDTSAQTIDVTVTGVASTNMSWVVEISVERDGRIWSYPT